MSQSTQMIGHCWDEVARVVLYGHMPALWAPISPQNIHGSGRCTAVDPNTAQVPTNITINDFLFIDQPGSQATALTQVCALLEILEVPTAPHKIEGPAMSLTFLGIELDANTLMARLPEGKLSHLGLAGMR